MNFKELMEKHGMKFHPNTPERLEAIVKAMRENQIGDEFEFSVEGERIKTLHKPSGYVRYSQPLSIVDGNTTTLVTEETVEPDGAPPTKEKQ